MNCTQEKERSITQILDMVITVITGLFHELMTGLGFTEFLSRIDWLVGYANEELDKIRNMYQSMVPRFEGHQFNPKFGSVKVKATEVDLYKGTF